jgi:type VI secretion system protein ImpI
VFGLDVKITNQDGTSTEQRFERFPVRIGRNALNDLRLESGYVSQFHATLELVGDEVHLIDLGSRNGTMLPGMGRVAPNEQINLTKSNYEFAIAMTIFRVTLVNLDEAALSRRRGGVHDIAEEMTRPHGTDLGDAMASHFKPLYDEYRQAWGRLYQELQATIGRYDGEVRQRVCEDLMVAHPYVALEPDFKRIAGNMPSGSHIQIEVEAVAASADPPREEAVALHGLKQMAAWYMPNSPAPNGVEDIIGFLQTIQDTLDVFMKCFVPLRDGYKQFQVQMDLQRMRSRQQNNVETAPNPSELAKALLDWRRVTGDEPRVIEDTFADLMTHQVAMLNGVMKGVKSLLSELSPETVERTLEDPRKNRGGLQIGPFRYKQLWEMYIERHQDLSAEDKQAFALIFGPQFAQAYMQFVEGVAPPPTNTAEIGALSAPTETPRGGGNPHSPERPYWPPRR